MSNFKVEKASDLLSLQQFNDLSPKEQAAYLKVAKDFVDAFNEANPAGKAVTASIIRINLGERVNVVLKKHADLSTEVISFPYNVGDAMAANLGAGSSESLVSLVNTTVEPLTVKMTVKAVNAGDTYETGAGESRTYKVPAMVKVDGTREEIVLSDDAHDILATVHQELLREGIRASMASRRKARTGGAATVAPKVAQPEEAGADI